MAVYRNLHTFVFFSGNLLILSANGNICHSIHSQWIIFANLPFFLFPVKPLCWYYLATVLNLLSSSTSVGKSVYYSIHLKILLENNFFISWANLYLEDIHIFWKVSCRQTLLYICARTLQNFKQTITKQTSPFKNVRLFTHVLFITLFFMDSWQTYLNKSPIICHLDDIFNIIFLINLFLIVDFKLFFFLNSNLVKCLFLTACQVL